MILYYSNLSLEIPGRISGSVYVMMVWEELGNTVLSVLRQEEGYV